MAKAQLKTQKNEASVEDFLNSVSGEQKKNDAFALLGLMKKVTGREPKMWGPAIVGFGEYTYKYNTGREGDWFLMGFSPRKQNLTIYIMTGYERHPDIMARLGKYKTGKSCLYINKLSDVNEKVLSELLTVAQKDLKVLKAYFDKKK